MEIQYLLSSIQNFEPVLVHWWVGLLSHRESPSIGWNFFYPIMSKEMHVFPPKLLVVVAHEAGKP